jgi:hypothetical protein
MDNLQVTYPWVERHPGHTDQSVHNPHKGGSSGIIKLADGTTDVTPEVDAAISRIIERENQGFKPAVTKGIDQWFDNLPAGTKVAAGRGEKFYTGTIKKVVRAGYKREYLTSSVVPDQKFKRKPGNVDSFFVSAIDPNLDFDPSKKYPKTKKGL